MYVVTPETGKVEEGRKDFLSEVDNQKKIRGILFKEVLQDGIVPKAFCAVNIDTSVVTPYVDFGRSRLESSSGDRGSSGDDEPETDPPGKAGETLRCKRTGSDEPELRHMSSSLSRRRIFFRTRFRFSGDIVSMRRRPFRWSIS